MSILVLRADGKILASLIIDFDVIGGINKQLLAVSETITFMADGPFIATVNFDHGVTRNVNAGVGIINNKFTTTHNQNSGMGSRTYSISLDGANSVTFSEEDGGQDTTALSSYGRTVSFGYDEFSDSEQYAFFGFGLDVKWAPMQRFMSPGVIFLLLS